ncbi:Hypothetical Protein SLY_0312 [Strawberry lethal yellows phytoplasma (CPA) str. NZSb11]|uniref:Uncharacterized protein n=1 Tax=Strawberry lethal yellows phytoplasma (CPA) str. NZSb11 TaxID=980422 RepID=R4S0A6_PHYAS|nr:Hypothetical Protein SLY_0312 [Strawberry lethal yellows phytoplasma (CPA) str. NZSb11]
MPLLKTSFICYNYVSNKKRKIKKGIKLQSYHDTN